MKGVIEKVVLGVVYTPEEFLAKYYRVVPGLCCTQH